MIDLYASQPHYLDHLLDATAGMPVRVVAPTAWLADHAHARGARLVTRGNCVAPGGPTLIAGYADARGLHPARPLGLVEHGAGQTYRDVEHQGYAGGPGWTRLRLVLVPGPHAAQAWQTAYPDLQVIQVGAPQHQPRDGKSDGRVAVTFHWPCTKSVESGTAWRAWQEQVPLLRDVLGHWHPRWDVPRRPNPVERWWQALDVPYTADPEDVFAHADVLVCDNTSLAYEFAATGRPVVSLNAPHWRKDVHHGLRFWSHIPGLVLDPGDDLRAAVDAALCGAGEPQRRAAVQHVYGGSRRDGQRALAQWVQSYEAAAQYAPPR